MRKWLIAALACSASAGAWALTDPVTGLSWEFVGGYASLPSYTQRADGYTLATETQTAQLIADLFGANPSSATFSASGPNLFPNGYYQLEGALGSFVQYSAEGTYAYFVASSVAGAPGTVAVGTVSGGYSGPSAGYPQGSYSYYAGISDIPEPYPNVGVTNYAVALVAAVPEPSEAGLLAIGLGLVAWRLRRRG